MPDVTQAPETPRCDPRQTYLLGLGDDAAQKKNRKPRGWNSRLDTLAAAELLREELGDIRERLCRIEAALETLQAMQHRETPAKEFYTTGEIASILGKAKFTVREWCRNERINAERGISGRGADAEWRVSHAELLRIQNEGLLPAAMKRRRP